MKVVVTGGSGQLGSLVLARLIGNRKIKRILALDVAPPMVSSPKLEWKIADVRDPGLDRHFEGMDALVHLAFIVAGNASAETMHAVNVEGSQRMFEHAAHAGLRSIVHASSVSAYGMLPDLVEPLLESTPLRDSSLLTYASNKTDVERYLDAFEEYHPELRVVRMRPGVLIGRRTGHGLGSLLERRILFKAGDAPLPVVWDEDVADAFVLALLGEQRGAFNLVAEDALPADELARAAGFRCVTLPAGAVSGAARAIGAVRRVAPNRLIDPGWIAASAIRMVASSERARRELGWKPRCPTAADVLRRFAAEAPRRLDPRIAVFMRMVDAVGRRVPDAEIPKEAQRMSLSLHLDITGPGGGDFAFTVKEGRPAVKRGIPRPPDATVRLAAATLLDLLSGKQDLATAQLSGKVQLRGEPAGGFVLGGLVTGFRNRQGDKGVRGFAVRRMSNWFSRDGARGDRT